VDVEPESGSTNIKTYQVHENHSAAKAELPAGIEGEKKN
jgi:hypothetical protein